MQQNNATRYNNDAMQQDKASNAAKCNATRRVYGCCNKRTAFATEDVTGQEKARQLCCNILFFSRTKIFWLSMAQTDDMEHVVPHPRRHILIK
jgi:hypothetical protein